MASGWVRASNLKWLEMEFGYRTQYVVTKSKKKPEMVTTPSKAAVANFFFPFFTSFPLIYHFHAQKRKQKQKNKHK